MDEQLVNHITDELNGLVGENVTVMFNDGCATSGTLKCDSVGFVVVTKQDLHVRLSKDSIKMIRKSVVV